MSNTPIAQIAASTIKGTEKQNIYPKTIDKAVLTTDKEGNEDTLDNILIKGIDINGETVTPDENGVIDISAAIIESIDTEESQEDGGNNVVTITMTNEDEYTFNIKNGTKGSDGNHGAQGKSAYQSYYDTTQDDPKMTEAEWVASLKGEDGEPGQRGIQGPQGPRGLQGNSGYTGAVGELEVVNNFEDGGYEKALSAERGKELNDRLTPVENELDIDTSSDVVTERIPYVQNYGYINGNSITTQSSNSQYRYSDPIFLKAGESLKIKAVTPSNIGRLASCDSQGSNVTRLLVGTSANPPTSASDAYENTYTAAEDIYLIVGWYWNFYQLELTKTYTKVTTTSKADDIGEIDKALNMESESGEATENVNITEKIGGYSGSAIGKQASYSSGYTMYKCSEPFLLKKGDALQIVTKNVASNVSVLAIQDGALFRTIALGNAGEQTTNYTAPLDGYYAVTWLNSTGVTITKTYARSGKKSTRLDTIEESIPSKTIVNNVNSAVFSNVTDDMTTGYVDGKYIAHNGAIGSNSSFAYKEFSVRNGAVIQGSIYSHQNIAILAKKTSTGYVELVAGTGQTTESFSYTATEDMTIAVSFTLNKDRSITINTQLIASNAANIAVLFNKVNGLQMPDYGMFFDKVAVIGDSISVGTLDSLTGGHAAGGSFNCSWLTYLAKKWGSTIRMHYSRGGTTCYDWIGNNDYGLGLMLKDSVVYDVYFVAYGHNDAGQFTIGTTSDTPTDVTVDANNDVTMETAKADTTFFGNYKKIVNEIRTKAPNAIIFLVSTDSKDSTTSGTVGYMNQYIQELAEWYYEQGDHRIFYIGYSNKLDIGGETAGYHTGGHFSTFGYAYVASIINECVNEVIMDNLNTIEIKEWGKFIGSGYRTTEIDTTTSGGYLPHL